MKLSDIAAGRPAQQRTETENSIYDYLESLHIPFARVDHDPADTMEDCRIIEKKLGTEIPKNLVLANRQNTTFYLLLMPGEKPFRTKEITSQLGCARLSFASPEILQRILHTIPGSASVLELLFDTGKEVNLVIDRDLLEQEHAGFHPGRSSSTLKLSMEDVLRFVRSTGHEPVFVTLQGEETPCSGEESQVK